MLELSCAKLYIILVRLLTILYSAAEKETFLKVGVWIK